ncbi:hypothetical protein SUGI_1118510 [Cryptomeria japonica]|nr:hypothetical protein SUGI_1118510 [Cryptomeria japonica]
MRCRANSHTAKLTGGSSDAILTMQMRKEESGKISEAELSRVRGCKRKCAEEANELIRAVINSEMLSVSSEDSLESSSEEHNNFTSVSPREEDSQILSDNTGTSDILLEGCNRSRGLSSAGIGGKNCNASQSIEVSMLRDKNVSQRIGSTGTTLKKRKTNAGKAVFSDPGVSESSRSICSRARMSKKSKAMENAPEKNNSLQDHGRECNVEIQSASQHFAAVENLDASDQQDSLQESGKSDKSYANKIPNSKKNGSGSHENHVVSDEIRTDLNELKGKQCLDGLVQGEQNRIIDGKVQVSHSYQEDTEDSCQSAVLAKKNNQKMTNPIAQSPDGGMLLSRFVLPHTQEIKVYELNADNSNKNSGHRSCSLAASTKPGEILGHNGHGSSEELKERAITLSPETNLSDGNVARDKTLDDKDRDKNMLGNRRRHSLPILLKKTETPKQVPLSELRKNLRERAKVRLLAAGWKIELKPRIGRDYQDSVYVSPSGSAFWSLPKAWNALRKSLVANATKIGKAPNTKQLKANKRPLERRMDFWSELDESLTQLDSGEQNSNICAGNQKDIVNIDDHIEHSMQGCINGHSFPCIESLHSGKQESMNEKLSNCGERGNMCGITNQSGMCEKHLETREHRSVHGKACHVAGQRCIHEMLLSAAKESNIPGKKSNVQKQSSTHEKRPRVSKKKCMEEKLLSARELRRADKKLPDSNKKNPQKKLPNSGELKFTDNQLPAADLKNMHENYCDSCEQNFIHDKLLHDLDKRDMHNKLPSVTSERSICEKVLHAGDLEDNFPVQRERNGKVLEQSTHAESCCHEHCKKSILKGEISEHGDAQLASTNTLKNERSEEEQQCLAESNSNEQEACRESEHEVTIERELSRQLSELELGKNSNRLISRSGGRRFDKQKTGRLGGCSTNEKVGMMAKYCNDPVAIEEWSKEQSGKISFVSQIGRKSKLGYPRVGTSGRKSNELKASKPGRKSKESQVGRQINKSQVGKCPKCCMEHGGIENESKAKRDTVIIEDDNVTLASILKNRRRSSWVAEGSGDMCTKKKIVNGKTIFSPGEKNKNRRGGCALSVRSSGKRDSHPKGQRGASSTSKRTVLRWLIDAGIVSEGEPVQYLNKNSNRIVKHGWITRDGIHCKCCKRVLSVSNFNTHAGSQIKRAFSNIFVQSGKSLTMCQIEAWFAEYKNRKGGMRFIDVDENDQNDDACGFCGDGGDLICCDRCPSTFHQDCLTLKDVPEGNWYCSNCTCGICGEIGHDEEKEIVSDLLICDQCEHKYHKKCLHERAIQVGESNETVAVFCGQDCKMVSAGLQQLLGISNPIEEGLTWTLLRSINEDQRFCSPQSLALMAECNLKLAVALAVMEECFERMVDPRTGIDMIPQVVYSWGSNFSRLNYQGFYTVVLEREDDLISVASIRIHGGHFAEMPLIATCEPYRRQGMCRRLVHTIEKMLISLNVKKLILSAVPELLEYWTTVFGFKPLEDSQKQLIKNMNMMTFPGTTLLQKYIFKPEIQSCGPPDWSTSVKDNALAPQAQRCDAQSPQLKESDTNSAISVWSNVEDGSTLIQTPPSRILAKVDELKSEHGLESTLIEDNERTLGCHGIDVLDSQTQVNNEISALEKVSTESLFCIPSYIAGGDTTTEITPCKVLIDAKMRKDWRGSDNALTKLELISAVLSSKTVSDSQLQGDSAEVSMLEKTKMEYAHYNSDDTTITNKLVDTCILPKENEMNKEIKRRFEKRPLSCLQIEEMYTETYGNNMLIREEESSVVHSDSCVSLTSQMWSDIPEAPASNKISSESAQLVPITDMNPAAVSNTLPEEEEILTTKKDIERAYGAEEERTSSCLKDLELDAQAQEDGTDIPVLQKSVTESVLCVPDDMNGVDMLKMSGTSGMPPNSEIRLEHDKGSGSITALEEKRFMVQLVSMRADTQNSSGMDLEGMVYSEEESVDIKKYEFINSQVHRQYNVKAKSCRATTK